MTNWICWRCAINLPVKVGHSPLITRVRAFSLSFGPVNWQLASLGRSRKGAVEPLTCEVECILQMGVVSVKQPKPCLITYPVVLVV